MDLWLRSYMQDSTLANYTHAGIRIIMHHIIYHILRMYVVPSADKMVALLYTYTQPYLDAVVRHLLHDPLQVVKLPSVFALPLQCSSALPWLVLCLHLSKLVEKYEVCPYTLSYIALHIVNLMYPFRNLNCNARQCIHYNFYMQVI